MLLECKNCGAPLDARPNALSARCRYCKATSQTGQLKTVNPVTPPDWRAPRVWNPPAYMPAAPRPLTYQRVSSGSPLALIGTLPIVGVLITIAVVLVCQPRESPPDPPWGAGSRGPPSAQERADGWDGRTTFTCWGNDRATLSNRTVHFTDTPAFVAADNCTLTLEHCTVTANAPLTTSGNAEARIVGGRLTSLAPERPAAVATDNSHIVLLSDAVLEAPTIALITTDNASIDAHRGRVIGTVHESKEGSIRGVAPRASATPSARARPRTKK